MFIPVPRHFLGKYHKYICNLFLGGLGGRGPPEILLKIGFKIVLFQGNFEHVRRNIAACSTLGNSGKRIHDGHSLLRGTALITGPAETPPEADRLST